MATKKDTSSWSDVKSKLANFERSRLIALVQDLYAAGKDNQIFLHARFGLGEDAPAWRPTNEDDGPHSCLGDESGLEAVRQ